MINSNDAAAESLPKCRHVVIAGIPGSGKATLRRWLAARCADRYRVGEQDYLIPWGEKTALDFHSPHALRQIREGKLLRSARYWTDYFGRIEFFLDQIAHLPFSLHLVMTGTYLSPGLRERLVTLGRGELYIVWLKVSPKVAKERLQRRLKEKPDEAFFQPHWIDEYMTLTEPPKATAGHANRLLKPTSEKNVYILDADGEAVGVKGNAIFDPHHGVPGLNASRRF